MFRDDLRNIELATDCTFVFCNVLYRFVIYLSQEKKRCYCKKCAMGVAVFCRFHGFTGSHVGLKMFVKDEQSGVGSLKWRSVMEPKIALRLGFFRQTGLTPEGCLAKIVGAPA